MVKYITTQAKEQNMNGIISDERPITYGHTETSRADPNKFESHCHTEFELLYVLQGHGKYVVEGAEYPLRPNTMMLIRPHEHHYVCPDKDSVYERYVINFNPNDLPRAILELSILRSDPDTRHGVFFSEDVISPLIEQEFVNADEIYNLVQEHKKSAESQKTVVISLLSRVLLLLSLSSPSDEIHYEENVITRITEYLDSHTTEPLSLDKLSQQFFISKYYLCHAFRHQNGISILAYLTAKRIVLAQQLLKDGKPAAEVAQLTGFQNYSSFYRAYLKQTGHSPTERSRHSP